MGIKLKTKNGDISLTAPVKTIKPITEEVNIKPDTEEQIITPSEGKYINKVTVEAIESETLEVTPSTEEQVKEGMFNKVTVAGIKGDNLEITPNTENQEFNGLYSNITVAGDSDLLPENIKSGANIFGVEGTGKVVDFEINDCRYLFYSNARNNVINDLLPLCKNVTNVTQMFQSSSNITELDLSNFSLGSATSMQEMFGSCTKLAKLNLKNLDTSKITNMSGVFYYCRALTELDLSGFNTAKVTNMSQMFNTCVGLTTLDLSSFDTSKVTNTSYTFGGCSALTKLIINNDRVFAMKNTNMFTGTPIASGTGYVYVPDDMVETYKSATNWSTYADQIKGMSELV